MSASFRTISFTFEAVRGEYLSRTQRATQRPAILFMLQMEIYGKPYIRRIYIYIYIDAAEAKLVSVGLAQARPNNAVLFTQVYTSLRETLLFTSRYNCMDSQRLRCHFQRSMLLCRMTSHPANANS